MRCTVVDGWGHSQSGLAGPCGGGAMNSHGGLMLVAPHASSGPRWQGVEISGRCPFFLAILPYKIENVCFRT